MPGAIGPYSQSTFSGKKGHNDLSPVKGATHTHTQRKIMEEKKSTAFGMHAGSDDDGKCIFQPSGCEWSSVLRLLYEI